MSPRSSISCATVTPSSADARRFFLLWSRRHLVAAFKVEQSRLAAGLQALYDRYAARWEAR